MIQAVCPAPEDTETLPPPRDAFAIGELIDGKYRVERTVAEGGVGVVVAARHVALNQQVAIKYLKEKSRKNVELVRRFEREARLTAQIQSEHVVRVFDVGTTPASGPYIVMELLSGKDLGAALDDGPLPVVRAIDWVLQACDALAETHALHIVHRDIKPENLFLADRPGKTAILKVIDFGISKLPPTPDDNGKWARETGVLERFGTPLYMSPEQLQSTVRADLRSDIWALGVVLFELVTAASPFVGDDMPRLCTSILTGEPQKLSVLRPTAPAGLEDVILKCLEKKPERRFRNVAELAQALAPFGPTDAEDRATRIREIVRRSGASIRPPTPAAVFGVQPLPTLDPPVLSVEPIAKTTPSIRVERKTDRNRWMIVVALAAVALIGSIVALFSTRTTVDANRESNAPSTLPSSSPASAVSVLSIPSTTVAATAAPESSSSAPSSQSAAAHSNAPATQLPRSSPPPNHAKNPSSRDKIDPRAEFGGRQ